MSITSVSGLTGSPQQQNIQNASAKLEAVLANLASGTQSGDNVAQIPLASQLQTALGSLRQISGNLAQASSLTQVASGGTEQIQGVLQQLQALAQQAAAPTTNPDTRSQLNDQFQQLAGTINQIATSTTFNGQSLLDGSVSGSNTLSFDNLLSTDGSSGNSTSLSITNLTVPTLFGGQTPVLFTPESAQQALASIGTALNQAASTNADIGSFQQSVNYAAAGIDSAAFNQQAATSALSDTDFADAATQSTLSNLQENAAVALVAQGNNITPSLLKLIS